MSSNTVHFQWLTSAWGSGNAERWVLPGVVLQLRKLQPVGVPSGRLRAFMRWEHLRLFQLWFKQRALWTWLMPPSVGQEAAAHCAQSMAARGRGGLLGAESRHVFNRRKWSIRGYMPRPEENEVRGITSDSCYSKSTLQIKESPVIGSVKLSSTRGIDFNITSSHPAPFLISVLKLPGPHQNQTCSEQCQTN